MLMRGNSSDSETYLKARVTSSVQTKCSPRLRNAKKDRSRSVALNSPCVRVGGLREVQACGVFAVLCGSGFVLTQVPQLAQAAAGNI